MRSSAHVLPPAAFKTWLTKQKAPAGGAGGGGGAKPDGKKLFTDGNGTATACGACHTLADAGTTATTGPDLGKVLAGKDAAFIRQSILKPDAEIAPGFQAGIMPKNYGDTLSADELDALVTYLSKVSGK